MAYYEEDQLARFSEIGKHRPDLFEKFMAWYQACQEDGALSRREYEAGLEAAGFEQISVEFTHQVADGMHGAIVKAVKTGQPDAKGLPVIVAAVTAGCC